MCVSTTLYTVSSSLLCSSSYIVMSSDVLLSILMLSPSLPFPVVALGLPLRSGHAAACRQTDISHGLAYAKKGGLHERRNAVDWRLGTRARKWVAGGAEDLGFTQGGGACPRVVTRNN